MRQELCCTFYPLREESSSQQSSHSLPHESGERLASTSPPMAFLQKVPELMRPTGKLIRSSAVHPSPTGLKPTAHPDLNSKGYHDHHGHLHHKLGKLVADPSPPSSSDRPSVDTKDSSSSKQERLILGKHGPEIMTMVPPKHVAREGPDARLVLLPTPAAAVPSPPSSPSSGDGVLILPGSKWVGNPAPFLRHDADRANCDANHNVKGHTPGLHPPGMCAPHGHSGSCSSSPSSSPPGSSEFLDSGSEDADAPAAHTPSQELHAVQPANLPSNLSSGVQATLQQLSHTLKGWHLWDHLPLLRAHLHPGKEPPCGKEALTYDSLCTLMRACAPMSWGPSSEQELEQLLSLALLVQERGNLRRPMPFVPPQQSLNVHTPKQVRSHRVAHQGADDGDSALPQLSQSAAAAAAHFQHSGQPGSEGHFGLAHAHSSAAPQRHLWIPQQQRQSPKQQQLQAAPAQPTRTPYFQFESDDESEHDQDVAASRGVLRADAQRERMVKMLSGKMGQELFGQRGALLLPAKVGAAHVHEC
ncbi:hypothetical protein DUNSADRAFT_11750 [Dunaliella salina]|uniref:Uncharacterized protein n=1 Tax=Dunaliella salina TaxID=3046 RepID=A0ABQ7GCV3_DUNSA|nr:hypothetical protein DUNSADRAFT_11750 [Dunaliella salina]|eukprot:KAF5832378.1 hypothetical protein DUNSADRAFT_11750 [Dunaliella salina]